MSPKRKDETRCGHISELKNSANRSWPAARTELNLHLAAALRCDNEPRNSKKGSRLFGLSPASSCPGFSLGFLNNFLSDKSINKFVLLLLVRTATKLLSRECVYIHSLKQRLHINNPNRQRPKMTFCVSTTAIFALLFPIFCVPN